MLIIGVIILAAVFVGWAIGRTSSDAESQSEQMEAEMKREQADAEAYRRLTQ